MVTSCSRLRDRDDGAPVTTRPTPPIELSGDQVRPRWSTGQAVPAHVVAALADACPIVVDDSTRAETSRDWWPLALHWALDGEVASLASLVGRPTSTAEVSAVAAICHEHHVPLTVAAGRSGVSGASVPVFGGLALDMTGVAGLVSFDAASGVAEVRAGTFGPDLEVALAAHDASVGHFPQSFDLATVGGWVACRGAGQYSTRYGKIEAMVAGLEVVLADGRVIRTGGAPAAAVGPDLDQLFIGSEGTLGIVTTVWLRTHPRPAHERRAAYTFATFGDGIDACRDILREGATPAVLRLYDDVESVAAGRGGDGTRCTLLVLDEGNRQLVDATMAVVDGACAAAEPAPAALVAAWLEHRNDTSALQALTRKGYVVDTMEIAAPWGRLAGLFDDVRAALMAVPSAVAATCHLSHSYRDGACLYFTFAATPPADAIESTYVALWDAGQRAVLAGGGNLSHHHGIGLNRARFVREALGGGLDVLQTLKDALDPDGILNPGKLGLLSPFGAVPWPAAGRRPACREQRRAELGSSGDRVRCNGRPAVRGAVLDRRARRGRRRSAVVGGVAQHRRGHRFHARGGVRGVDAACRVAAQPRHRHRHRHLPRGPGRVRPRPPRSQRRRALVRDLLQPQRRRARRPGWRPPRPTPARPRDRPPPRTATGANMTGCAAVAGHAQRR